MGCGSRRCRRKATAVWAIGSHRTAVDRLNHLVTYEKTGVLAQWGTQTRGGGGGGIAAFRRNAGENRGRLGSDRGRGQGPARRASARCGVERWGVKTLFDPAANQVSFAPRATTVDFLRTRPDSHTRACGEPARGRPRCGPRHLPVRRVTGEGLVECGVRAPGTT